MLVTRGHDVTCTPNAWMARDAADTEQLLGATAQGRVLFTFNTHDSPVLVQQYPQHGGLVLAAQQSWSGTASDNPSQEVSRRAPHYHCVGMLGKATPPTLDADSDPIGQASAARTCWAAHRDIAMESSV